MNFDPIIPTGIAVVMGLLAASMWGTWFISLKYIGKYPLEAFYITLFTTSMILVWGVGFILDGPALFGNLKAIWQTDSSSIDCHFCLWHVVCCRNAIFIARDQSDWSLPFSTTLSIHQPDWWHFAFRVDWWRSKEYDRFKGGYKCTVFDGGDFPDNEGWQHS